jgi:hypothetical protein
MVAPQFQTGDEHVPQYTHTARSYRCVPIRTQSRRQREIFFFYFFGMKGTKFYHGSNNVLMINALTLLCCSTITPTNLQAHPSDIEETRYEFIGVSTKNSKGWKWSAEECSHVFYQVTLLHLLDGTRFCPMLRITYHLSLDWITTSDTSHYFSCVD